MCQIPNNYGHLPIGKKTSMFKCLSDEERKDIIIGDLKLYFSINDKPVGDYLSLTSLNGYKGRLRWCTECKRNMI